MINANELRIGNWVIGILNQHMKIAIVEHNPILYPIPLTPEILRSVGFVNREDEVVFKVNKWSWHGNDAYHHQHPSGGGTLSKYLLPATLTEYNQFINQKQK